MRRGDVSSFAMISIVRRFGAPVMEAGGNAAGEFDPAVAFVRAVTVEVNCHTVGYLSAWHSDATCTLPGSSARAGRCGPCQRSLHSRRDPCRNAPRRCSAWSSAGRSPLGAVPFMGRDSICSPLIRRKSSGEALQTAPLAGIYKSGKGSFAITGNLEEQAPWIGNRCRAGPVGEIDLVGFPGKYKGADRLQAAFVVRARHGWMPVYGVTRPVAPPCGKPDNVGLFIQAEPEQRELSIRFGGQRRVGAGAARTQ